MRLKRPYIASLDYETTDRVDVYTKVTQKIIADLEQGVPPKVKPWNAEHSAGLRHNG